MFGNDRAVFTFHTPFGFLIEIRQSLAIVVMFYLLFTVDSASNALSAVILLSLIVIAIFLHEMGHAWGCTVQKVMVRRVVLYGGGGFCEHRASTYGEDELIVAMGPIVNLALWAIASMIADWGFAGMDENTTEFQFQLFFWVGVFAHINISLFLFNMVPVQPLDGGRLFHILMRKLFPPLSAQRITGAVGVVFSVLWLPGMFLLYYYNGWLLFFIPSLKLHLAMMRGDRVL